MQAGTLLGVALGAITTLLLVLTAATVIRKALAARTAARLARLQAAVQPVLVELLGADTPNLEALVVLTGAHGRTAERLVAGLVPKLRGADRDALVGVLEQRGALARARERTRRPGRVGRARAAELLGAAGDARAGGQLARLLGDRDPAVRAVAARALGKLADGASVPALLATLHGRRPVPASIVTMALLHTGPAAVDGLLEGLRSPSARVRAVCAELLGRQGAFLAATRLEAMLAADPDPASRRAAAMALGRLGLPAAVPELIEALQDGGDGELQHAAARALGEIGGDAAVAALTPALDSGSARLAQAAAGGLAACGQQGVHVLERSAGDAGRPGAPHAREALARLTIGRRSARHHVATA